MASTKEIGLPKIELKKTKSFSEVKTAIKELSAKVAEEKKSPIKVKHSSAHQTVKNLISALDKGTVPALNNFS